MIVHRCHKVISPLTSVSPSISFILPATLVMVFNCRQFVSSLRLLFPFLLTRLSAAGTDC